MAIRKAGSGTVDSTPLAPLDTLQAELEECRRIITEAYGSPVSIDDATLYAARFLATQMTVADELQKTELDARMRKNGVKVVSSKAYLDEVARHDKKPSDTLLENTVASHELVKREQEALARAEVRANYLDNYYNILKDGHIFFRGIAKGKYD